MFLATDEGDVTSARRIMGLVEEEEEETGGIPLETGGDE